MRNRGIDLNASYSHAAVQPRQAVLVSFVGTRMLKARVDNGLSRAVRLRRLLRSDLLGRYGCRLGSDPEMAAQAAYVWQSNFGLGLSLQWRYVGKVKAETTQDNETSEVRTTSIRASGQGAELLRSRRVRSHLMDRVNLRAGVNNLFDNDPPRVTGGNANVDGYEPVPGRSVQRQHLSGYLGCAGPPAVGWCDDRLPASEAGSGSGCAGSPAAPAAPPPPATQTCPDGSVILATETCPVPPPPPPPPPPAPERG